MEKTYFDIKVTFVHIVVFLIAVIAIGIFLFYMGYQAGNRREGQAAGIASARNQLETSAANQEELNIVEEKPIKTVGAKINEKKTISEEMKLHEKPLANEVQSETPKKIIPDEKFAIQVGAFADFSNAQKYSEKFAKLGYQTEIIVETVNQKKLHTVRVGSFASLDEAQKEKDKLESLEKRKFKIKKGR